MLGTVKMEGHETSDWNSYYADTQEVSELRVRCPSEREKRGPGEGRGAEGGSAGRAALDLRLSESLVCIIPSFMSLFPHLCHYSSPRPYSYLSCRPE